MCLRAQAPAVDPFDALASSLPSVGPVAPQQPAYTGPEVKEVKHGFICFLYMTEQVLQRVIVVCVARVFYSLT